MELMKMSSVCCLYSTMLLISLIILVTPCGVTSFDITKLLSRYPAYSTFSNYLTQTELASAINARQSVTVLAVDNTGMGPLSGKSMHHIKNLLSLHVALRYLDVAHLQSNQTITVTTLFQAQAEGLFKLKIRNGTVTSGSSADPNGVVRAKLMKPVVSESHNISVVQVNSLMMPPTLLSNPNALTPVPVISPNPIPVKSPVPVIAPLPTPVPANTPSPVPVLSPVPVIAPVPVISPVPVVSPVPIITPVPVNPPPPVIAPVPVASPVPVIAPVPVVSPVPVMTPIPVMSPVPVMAPAIPGSGGASDAPAGEGSTTPADQPKSGVLQFGVNCSLAILLLTFSSIYINMLYH